MFSPSSSTMQFSSEASSIFCAVVAIYFLLVLWGIGKSGLAKWRNQIPGPVPLPIIGHLPKLFYKPHLALKKLSEKYGDVMMLHIGCRSVIVVNGIDAVREALTRTTHDFDGRSDSYIGNLVSCGGNDLVFAEYGEKWKLHRQLCVRGLAYFSGERMKQLENVIVDESHDLVSRILNMEGEAFDPRRDISLVVVNIICYMTFGCRHSKGDQEFLQSVEYIDIIAEAFEDSLGNMIDFFPWLKMLRIPSLNRLKAGLEIRDKVMSDQLEAHRSGKTNRNDFTSFLLQQNEKFRQKGKEVIVDKNLKMLMFDLFGAGVDTTVVAIRWAIVYLLHRPTCQRKMVTEIDSVRPNKAKIGFADIKDLPYTQAVVYETLRLCSLFPITPRKATRDTCLLGYSIKKGTDVIFNLWGVNHDEKYWARPNEFIPERFIDSNGNLKSLRNLSYAPFSIGSRGCPGATIAQREIFLILATLVQLVEIKPAEKLPSFECISTISYKPEPYHCVFYAR